REGNSQGPEAAGTDARRGRRQGAGQGKDRMAIEVTMPQLGESFTEGTVGAWLKREGDAIRRDEPLVEVITDKVNAEVPSPVDGTVVKILVREGETVPVGQPIALIEAPSVGAGNGTGAAQPIAGVQGHGPAGTAAEGTVAAGVRDCAGDSAMRRRYSPVVRRLAKEHGIDLTRIPGTGLGGRVTKKDVMAYLARGTGERETMGPGGTGTAAPPVVHAVPARPAAPAPAGGDSDGDQRWDVMEPDPVRRTIAERMVQSWQEIPHAWAMVEADVTGLVRLREKVREEFQRREGVPLTYVPFWIKAVVQCLKEEPRLNATWQNGKIMIHRKVNVGLAVGVDGGLVVPVIPDADRHTIASLAREVHRLAEKARSGRLSLRDVQGG